MKILLIRTIANYIDVSEASYNLQEIGLARAFNKCGHQCDIVYWGGKINKTTDIQYDDNKYFKVFHLKALNVLKNGIFFELDKFCENYDILHCAEYDQIQSWLLANKFSDKLVIYHGSYYSDFNLGYNKKCKVFDKFFLSRYIKNNICFDTKSNLATDFLKSKGITNVTTIGVGIDLEQLHSKKIISSELSEELTSLKESGIELLTYIGRIEPRRNILFLLDMFKAVLDVRPNVRLVLIGRGENEYKNECFEYMKKLGIDEFIIYREYMRQEFLPAIYLISDVFLLPTRYEIFGMVLLEAMYFNTPVITTYNGGSDMLIEHNKSGIIELEFDAEQWKDSVIRLLEDKKFATELTAKAKSKIATDYTWDALVDKFIAIFEKQLSR